MAEITVQLPPELREWHPTLFPGSVEATNAGCLCPEHQPWPGELVFEDTCPIHTETERAGFTAYLNMKVSF